MVAGAPRKLPSRNIHVTGSLSACPDHADIPSVPDALVAARCRTPAYSGDAAIACRTRYVHVRGRHRGRRHGVGDRAQGAAKFDGREDAAREWNVTGEGPCEVEH